MSSNAMIASALLLTGTSGVGKSTVAGELYELLVSRSEGSAMIDLDALAKCDAGDHRGFFGSAIMADNLAAIWPNYRRRGVDRLVLARAVADLDELQRIQDALPDVHVSVCLLTADHPVLSDRLARRDLATLRGRRAASAMELQRRMIEAGVADFVVPNDQGADLSEVAAEVLMRWGELMESFGSPL